MVYGKFGKGLPPLRRPTLGKNKFKKLYESNKWWNDWRFQLHWNNIEWVNPRSLTKMNKTFSVSSRDFYLNKNYITSRWVGHSKVQELDTIEFF